MATPRSCQRSAACPAPHDTRYKKSASAIQHVIAGATVYEEGEGVGPATAPITPRSSTHASRKCGQASEGIRQQLWGGLSHLVDYGVRVLCRKAGVFAGFVGVYNGGCALAVCCLDFGHGIADEDGVCPPYRGARAHPAGARRAAARTTIRTTTARRAFSSRSDDFLMARGAPERRTAWSAGSCRAADQAVCGVGVTGFEPATSSSRTKRATKLRHTP